MWQLRCALTAGLSVRSTTRSSIAWMSTATEAATAQVKCLSCGQFGHIAKECPSTPDNVRRKNAQDYFRDGKCFVCGELGHVAKACPTLGGNPAEFKPLEPKHEKPSLAEKNAGKLCFQCGSTGHVMRDCPVERYTRKIKGITKRYSGSRLQKMLPALLRKPKELRPAHEVQSKTKPRLGVVVSTNTEKTIGVLIPRRVIHPRYKIPLDRSQKFLVHDEEQKAVCGDIVQIVQTRPISKRKHHALKDIVLSLNDRRAVRAAKVVESTWFKDLDVKLMGEIEGMLSRHQERVIERNKAATDIYAAEKAKITNEVISQMRDIPALISEAEEVVSNPLRNEAWIKEMKAKLENFEQIAAAEIQSGKMLEQEMLKRLSQDTQRRNRKTPSSDKSGNQ